MRNNWTHWLVLSLGFIIGCLPHWMVAQSGSLFAQVNSGYDEQFPILSPDGQSLYFIRNRHPNNMGMEDLPDIWKSRRKADGAWGPCVLLGMPINNLKPNFLAGLNTDGNTLYLTQTDGYQSWISITHQHGRRWSSPRAMIIDRFVPGATASFSVSPDEQSLIIASQQLDGLGSMDLYLSYRLEENRWSHPNLLAAPVNTSGKESWAMIAADGQTLYFASNGQQGGAGGLDLWMSRRKDADWQEWTEPVNLGPSINSPGEDVSIALADGGYTAIIARMTDQNQYDLREVVLPEENRPFPVAILSGRLLDEQTGQAKAGEVFYRFLGLENNKEQRLRLQDDGTYKVIVPLNLGIAFHGNLPGYLPLCDRFDKFPLAEQIDSTNAQIAAWAKTNAYYWQEEKAIHNAQNQLQLILDKKDALEKEKSGHRKLLAEKTYDELENENVIPTDPEMEALESRFNIYYRRRSDTLSLFGQLNKKRLPDQSKGTSTGESKKEFEEPLDEATLKLSRQFRKQRSTTNLSAKTGPYSETQMPVSFQDLRKRAEKEATYAMLPRVQAELVQDMFPQAWRTLQQTVSAPIFRSLAEKEDSIRIRIRHGLGQFILAPDPFQANISQEDQMWWRQLKTDLKNILRQHIYVQLEQNLRAYVLKAIQLELNHQVVQRMEENQRKLLNDKIEQQKNIEMNIEEFGTFLDQVPRQSPLENAPDTTNAFIQVEKDLILTPIQEGHLIELKNVRFSPDSLVLKPDSYPELDSIVHFLKTYEDILVEIRTHTHGYCDHTRANDLTIERAHLIRDYFIVRGIPSQRIKYTGLGKKQPRADNKTLEGRALNQRIELKILGIGETD